jgi:selenide, water dikinase
MHEGSIPLISELVLLGGGHAHALVLRRWGMAPVPGVRLTLINPGPTAPYTGMLPGHVAGHYARDALDIDLVRLARFAGARLVLGAVDRIDPVARALSVPGARPSAMTFCRSISA